MKYTIEQYDEMPSTEKIRDKRKWWHYKDPKIGDYGVRDIIERVIKNNLGKSFDMAFHYYCTLVPIHMQHWFLKEFEPKTKPWLMYWNFYYIDNEGIIQEWKKERTKKSITINLKPNKYLYLIKDLYKTGKYKWIDKKPLYCEVFKTVCIEDNTLYFTSKNDYKFKRLMREKKGKKIKKVKPSIEDFRPLLRAKQLKEKEETRLKLEAKGMSPNAFRGDRIR